MQRPKLLVYNNAPVENVVVVDYSSQASPWQIFNTKRPYILGPYSGNCIVLASIRDGGDADLAHGLVGEVAMVDGEEQRDGGARVNCRGGGLSD